MGGENQYGDVSILLSIKYIQLKKIYIYINISSKQIKLDFVKSYQIFRK